MPKYYDVEPLVNLLADKDPLESVNVGAVLQALQHGLYNGEVAPVVHAHWERIWIKYSQGYYCTNCNAQVAPSFHEYAYCPNCGAKMDEKEG